MHPQYINLSKQAKNITGRKFNRLTALGPVYISKYGRYVWHCLCDCGIEVDVAGECLRSGATQSCGCLHRERTSNANRTHGLGSHPLYATWESMLYRCNNPASKHYPRYGGRGIGVCDEWQSDPQAFIDYVYSLPDCNAEGYTLDRIDNNSGYSPGNMRWASKKTQQRNTRSNRLLTHNGKTQCISAWAEELGINERTLRSRILSNWPVDRALSS